LHITALIMLKLIYREKFHCLYLRGEKPFLKAEPGSLKALFVEY
jgi:hypothetical protein